MKKVMYGILLLFIIGGFSIAYFNTEPKVLAPWNGTEEQIVLPNAVLKIPFSQKISTESINTQYFYVKDSQGNKLDVSLSLSDEGNSVEVAPPKGGYDIDTQNNTLYIKRGVKTENGRSLSKGYSYSFRVKEELPVIGDAERLKKYFAEILKDEKRSEGFFGTAVKEEKSSSSKDSGGNVGHSETNVQVQGIDEGDHVKTNGKHIFQIVEKYIRIVKAVPANSMKQEALITYDHTFHPVQLYVHNQKLVVIGQSYREEGMQGVGTTEKKMMYPKRGMQTTKVFVYDISNPSKPTELRVLETEGNFLSSRKKEGKLFVVTQYMPDLWLMREGKELELRPMIFDSKFDDEIHPVPYPSITYMPNSNEGSYSIITTLDLDHTNKKSNVFTFLGSGSDLYMSENHFYLAVRNYAYQPNNKKAEIGWFYSPDTTIYKFSINGLKVTFQASAEIKGNVLNQFSMDEHEGYFRIATTEGNTWDDKNPSANHLFILDENLHQVGKLKDLARGEKIYSARFMGDRVYIVTFKEVDPLFVIDTSEPNQPKILGELKIPGFSNYLHPYDEDHLIGFGHDTKILTDKNNTHGQPRIVTNGVKISLFDVSDLSNPKEKFSQVIGDRGSYSPLNHDHKALLWNRTLNMFAFPVSVYREVKGTEFEQKFEFQGGYVFSVDPTKGFILKNKITHQKGTPVYEDWETSIDRFVYIGNTLYSISPYAISAHDFTTTQKIGTLEIN